MSNDRLIKTLITHEGLRLHVYDDATGKPIVAGTKVKGNPTIGVGRLLTSGRGLTEEEAIYLLNNDIRITIDALKEKLSFWDDLSIFRQEVLVNMGINLGVKGLLGFKNFIKSLSQGDYHEAEFHMLDSLWAAQVKGRSLYLAYVMKNDEIPTLQ